MDRFTAMRMFTRVVELRSFTRAADSLGVPKATLSLNIQELETLLGVKLLNRTTRQVSPTSDGAAYYENALRLLQDIEEVESSLTHAVTTAKGRLRVDASASARDTIIPVLPEFYERYPDIQLELGCSDRPVDLVQENVDCVIRAGDIVDHSLAGRKIGEFRNITCGTQAYFSRYGKPETVADLENHIFINYFSSRTGKMRSWVFEKDGIRTTHRGKHLIALNDGEAYVRAGIAGLGLFQAPSHAVQAYLDAGIAEQILKDYDSDSTVFHILYPPNRHLSARVRVFSEWVATVFSRLEDKSRARSS
ncbi:MAG: LysR substrate-binding domain-containing protein [Pedobacter sp.]|nr:LysR substrate-binding domain-containing protein [Pedobacter sp.]